MTSSALGRVTLTWTAPGDDDRVGSAAAYDLRYSLYPIDENTFPSARPAFALMTPRPAGTQEYFTVEGLLPLESYYFAIKSVDEAGNWSLMSNVVRQATTITVSTGDEALPFAFSKPYPNPARAMARFEMTMPRETQVRIEVFDIGGRRVRTLLSGSAGLGRRSIEWNLEDADGRRVSPGLYIVFARLGETEFRQRVMVAR